MRCMRKAACAAFCLLPMANRKSRARETPLEAEPAWIDGLAAHTLGLKLRIPRSSQLKSIQRERKRHALLNAALSAAIET